MSEREDFGSRWSRRKIDGDKAEEGVPPEQDQTGEGAAPELVSDQGVAQSAALEPLDETAEPPSPVDHIDIEKLEYNDDFSVFLQSGVPDRLRRMALRKLWASNPIFDGLDGLNDYDDDFTDAALAVKTLKTAYQVGKGYVDNDDDSEDDVVVDAEAGEIEAGEIEDGGEAQGGEGETEADEHAEVATDEDAGDDGVVSSKAAPADKDVS